MTGPDALDHLPGQLAHVPGVVGDRGDAVVARGPTFLAGERVEPLGKVAEQLLPPAVRLVLAVLDHPVEVVDVHLVVHVVAFRLYHSPDPGHVRVVIVEDAAGRAAVPPSPPRLLVVPFHGLGEGVVDHETDVGFVDAHAEGYGGADHLKSQRG